MKFKAEKYLNKKNLWTEIDNPGRGDCGFYAFAIGLINVIQREIAKDNGNANANVYIENLSLLSRGNFAYTIENFKNFSYEQNEGNDRDLLENLKIDLRKILYDRYLSDLKSSNIIIEGSQEINGNITYNEFSQIFYWYYNGIPYDKKLNLLSSSRTVCVWVRDLSESIKAQGIQDPAVVEAEIKKAFMRDLYGDNYLVKTQIDWKESLSKGEALSPEEKEIVANFKIFKALAGRYYNYSRSDLILAPGFKYLEKSLQCAESMKAYKELISHGRVKILINNQPQGELELENGTLYFQINPETRAVSLYSTHLGKEEGLNRSELLPVLKGEDLINTLQRKRPEFLTDGTTEINIESHSEIHIRSREQIEERKIFTQISAKGDDILLDQEEFITTAFLNAYQTKLDETSCELRQLKMSEESIKEFEEKAQLQMKAVEELLKSDALDSLNFEEKEHLRKDKARNLELAPTSKIKNALDLLKRDRRWLATHKDLNTLAEIFNVHLENLENDEPNANSQGENTEKKPVITINNLNKIGVGHWTTRINIADLVSSSPDSSEKYARWAFKKSPLSKDEIKNILETYTKGFVSFFGRRDIDKAMAQHLIGQCQNNEVSVSLVMKDFRDYMKQQGRRADRSLLKRFEYLEGRYRNSEIQALQKGDIEKEFLSYIDSGMFRNHRDEALRIIGDCRDDEKTVADVLERIEDYVNDPRNHFNKNISGENISSFIKRVERIREIKNFYDGKYADGSENFEEHVFGGLARIGDVY